MTTIIKAALRYAPTTSGIVMPGNRVSSKAVPGADQAVIMGSFRYALRSKPLKPAPMEIAQIQEISKEIGLLQ